MRSALTDRQHDNIAKINEYIIEQVRRKIEPLYIKINKRNFKSQLNSPRYQQTSPSLRKTIASQPLEALTKATLVKRNRKKMLSTAIIIEKQKKCINYRHTMDPNDSNEDLIKYEELRNKVERHIEEQRRKIHHLRKDSKKYLRLSNNLDEKVTYICFNRNIITTAIKPYDFRLAFEEIKKTQRRQKNEQILGRVIKHDLNNSGEEKSKMLSNSLKKQQQQDLKTGKQNVQQSRFKKQKKTKNKQKKKTVGFQKIKRKNSIMFGASNDDVDKQFEEGLVEQIYTSKRIKFRKKINQIKSRKNLVEGNLYFLKQ